MRISESTFELAGEHHLEQQIRSTLKMYQTREKIKSKHVKIIDNMLRGEC